MADSHAKSNIVAKDGTQEVTGFAKVQGDRVECATLTATNARVNTLESTTYVKSTTYTEVTTYVKVGTAKYIFSGNETSVSASIVAAATALVATPIKGSIYMGNGEVWGFDSDTTATKMW